MEKQSDKQPEQPAGLDYSLARQVAAWATHLHARDLPVDKEAAALRRLIQVLIEQIAAAEPLHFSTPYSLMAYIIHRYGVPGWVQQALHRFRRLVAQPQAAPEQVKVWGYRALSGILEHVYQLPPEPVLQTFQSPFAEEEGGETERKAFRSLVAVQIIAILPQDWIMIGIEPDRPEQELRIQGNVPERNERFNDLFQALQRPGFLPIRMNLVDCEFDGEGVAFPAGLILEPDHLVDVTAVAECFHPEGTFPQVGLLRRFLPTDPSKYLLTGQVANVFLDLLMQDPDLSFAEAFQHVFQISPLGFTLLPDAEIREIHTVCRRHFQNLQTMVRSGFRQEGIQVDDCFLEPTFLSPVFGLQGRLDVLYVPPTTDQAKAIVELKSGSPFRPNAYGLNSNHYIQTLLYDLLVRETPSKGQALTYILYSKAAEKPLRFAPVVKARQWDGLWVRNQLVIQQHDLQSLAADDPASWSCLGHLTPKKHPRLKGFHARDLERFSSAWRGLDELERAYFTAQVSFIEREFAAAKTGRVGAGSRPGQAALWLWDDSDKSERFALLHDLALAEDHSQESEPRLVFDRTEDTPALANFRVGDIAILYPQHADRRPTADQLWKCSLVEIDPRQVTVRLRAVQFNKSLFQPGTRWRLEPDLLDASFTQLTRSIFAWAEAPRPFRQKLLGRIPPELPEDQPIQLGSSPTPEQAAVIQAMLRSKDYFLIWGPPGTGKTSVVLREIVDWLWHHTQERILLLAYTNRAVDELCEAVEAIHPDFREHYRRIGSRTSTSPAFRDRLLQHALSQCTNRESVKQLLQDTRIFTGTVSSVLGRRELFDLVSFNRVIIDEASQLLEPSLAGLLARFPHFTLIGDHRQLPAVVAQPFQETALTHDGLQNLGFHYTADSLFERLYAYAASQSWHHVLGELTAQGRMHEAIMAFPNNHFYGGRLRTIRPDQSAPCQDPEILHPLHARLANHRLAFLPVEPESGLPLGKTNAAEAEQIVACIVYYRQLWKASGREWTARSLGVITPFRAQIALIRSALHQAGENPEEVTIDTVERYQGGARDIILISLVIRHPREMAMITSEREGAPDRKLNVAMTRARERLVILGHPPALEQHPQYAALLDYSATEHR